MRIIVTGAASGIGRAAAFRLVHDSLTRDKKAAILLVDIAEDALDHLASEIRALGGDAFAFRGDLSDPMIPGRIVAEATARLGGLDVLVSNAGVLANGPLAELDLESYDRSFAVNTRATWLLAKSAFPLLKDSRGCIVATASVSAEAPTPPLGAYSASKAALVMLIKQLAYEWGPFGIRCNCLSPGATHTGMTDSTYRDPVKRAERGTRIPLGRVGLPEDMAAAISFLTSPDAAYITGINLPVEGGILTSLMPNQGAAGGARG